MIEPKYKLKDRVRPRGGSTIYIVDGYVEDEETGKLIYALHSLTTDTEKFIYEDELDFAGYSFMF